MDKVRKMQMHEDYKSDPVIWDYKEQMKQLIERELPSYLLGRGTITPIRTQSVKEAIDKIELECKSYIDANYSELFTTH